MWHLQWYLLANTMIQRLYQIHRAYLTYDTLWALPSKVVYGSRSAYILSMGGPNGNWSSYPDSAGADICSTHQVTEKMKSLTLAVLVLGFTHCAPWEIEFVTLTVAAPTDLHKRAANLQSFKGRGHTNFLFWLCRGQFGHEGYKNTHICY